MVQLDSCKKPLNEITSGEVVRAFDPFDQNRHWATLLVRLKPVGDQYSLPSLVELQQKNYLNIPSEYVPTSAMRCGIC